MSDSKDSLLLKTDPNHLEIIHNNLICMMNEGLFQIRLTQEKKAVIVPIGEIAAMSKSTCATFNTKTFSYIMQTWKPTLA